LLGFNYMKNIISAGAFTALQGFTGLADKSTGSSHSLDRQKWCRFLVELRQGGRIPTSNDVRDWFLQNGWYEDVAIDLVCEFEFACDLLAEAGI
jgi:hypothetical protein